MDDHFGHFYLFDDDDAEFERAARVHDADVALGLVEIVRIFGTANGVACEWSDGWLTEDFWHGDFWGSFGDGS